MFPNYPYKIINEDDIHSTDSTQEIAPKERLFHTSSFTQRSFVYYFLGSVVIILSFISGSLLHPISLSSNNRPHSLNQDSLREFIPYLSAETRKFEFNRTFANDPSEEVTRAWESLIPKGQGVIRLPVRNEFNAEVYNIAGYHALHCLYSVRESFFALHRMSMSNDTHNAAVSTADMVRHGRHCIEYIRQSLMCNPDLTLEPFDTKRGKLKEWGINRRCINFGELSDWACEMRLGDNEGIARR
ncbi:hypothetical protein M434DRAFT_31516 [Hypoxylon sp. CO27-5]|nr:hypothetical protein M434DRAFT_31516 [Hypoxylon sp. CO27-5]